MSSADDLRRIALEEFARIGYSASSLNHLAELAGVSKSSVLYHYANKEALLEAAVQPALDRLDTLISILDAGITQETWSEYIEQFVDFLLAHRLEVHIFINQGPSLTDLSVARKADDLVRRIAEGFRSVIDTLEGRIRVGVALGGAAFFLADHHMRDEHEAPDDELRAGLIAVLSELLLEHTEERARR